MKLRSRWFVVFSVGALLATAAMAQPEVEAKDELRARAEGGDPEAQVLLGRGYLEGNGSADTAQAAQWFARAAEQGNGEGQYNLGLLYIRGAGVPKDDVLAYMWLTLASERGRPDALAARDAAAGNMNPEQLGRARQLAREWQPVKAAK